MAAAEREFIRRKTLKLGVCDIIFYYTSQVANQIALLAVHYYGMTVIFPI